MKNKDGPPQRKNKALEESDSKSFNWLTTADTKTWLDERDACAFRGQREILPRPVSRLPQARAQGDRQDLSRRRRFGTAGPLRAEVHTRRPTADLPHRAGAGTGGKDEEQ